MRRRLLLILLTIGVLAALALFSRSGTFQELRYSFMPLVLFPAGNEVAVMGANRLSEPKATEARHIVRRLAGKLEARKFVLFGTKRRSWLPGPDHILLEISREEWQRIRLEAR